jgi:hypothetical protein
MDSRYILSVQLAVCTRYPNADNISVNMTYKLAGDQVLTEYSVKQ